MAYNDSPDNEFDQEMERILREHFDADADNLRASGDPWEWLESRLEERPASSLLSRLLGSLAPMREGRGKAAFTVARVTVVAVAAAATFWAVSGNGGPDAPAAPATPITSPTASGSMGIRGPAGPAGAVGQAGSAGADGQAGPAGPAGAGGQVGTRGDNGAAAIQLPQGRAGAAVPPTAAPAPATASGGSGQPPGTNFQGYPRQIFVEATSDNVSTFSLDTDHTSYHLALGWASYGYEINPDSVRAEEWINAFDYGYPPPSDSDEFAISSDLYRHPLDDGKLLARVAFQAPELVEDKPLNVTLVLDASGSMGEGNRVDIARQAAESIRQSLGAEDRIAVVHFTEEVLGNYTVEHRPPDDPRVRDSINWLQPHGGTNVQAGLNLGVQWANEARSQRPGAHNYVVLMSDGVANVDATDPFAILETAYDANTQNPLRLIAVGVGINNYNDVLLEQLAQHGNGWYRYLRDAAQAQATFSRENWLALSTPFADQTRAQVTWNPEVVARWRIIGYENRVTSDETFTQNRKEFAEIYSGASITVFYELELAEGLSLGQAAAPFEKIELRWVDPATGKGRKQSGGSPAALAVWGGGGFEGQPLAHLGGIVALVADRYGSLPGAGYDGDYREAHLDFTALQEQLRSLERDLGRLDAYNDFAFLLEHITGDVEGRLPPSTPSGYSR